MTSTKFNITVQPSVEPITLTEAKAHLRVDFSDEDTLITSLITVSRKWCETYMNRGIITQTWEQEYNDFFEPMPLAMNPVASITQIDYIDQDENPQTLAAANYQLDNKSDRANIFEGVSADFPSSVSNDTINPITVTYVVGYGVAADVPDDIKHAILILLAWLYENREMVNVPIASIATDIPLPSAVKLLLATYRLPTFG